MSPRLGYLALAIILGFGVWMACTATPARAQGMIESPPWVRNLVFAAAARHGVSGEKMLATIGCETGWTFNPGIVNPNRLDWGLAQFRIHLPSGYSLISETPYGAGLNPWDAALDPVIAVYAMAWLWERGYAGRWSCWWLMGYG